MRNTFAIPFPNNPGFYKDGNLRRKHRFSLLDRPMSKIMLLVSVCVCYLRQKMKVVEAFQLRPLTPAPTASPSSAPSVYPSVTPTRLPSSVPSNLPSATPSFVPSALPSTTPSISSAPTNSFVSFATIYEDEIRFRQYEILRLFFVNMGGVIWQNSSGWSDSIANTDFCKWHGIQCTHQGYVSQITLSQNNLEGKIPKEIGGIESMTRLSLSGNNITGSIPSEISGLTNLRELELQRNALSGTLSSRLGQLLSLNKIQLSENRLLGTIPSQLGLLKSLEVLALNANNFTGGLTSELCDLPNLQVLNLEKNKLSGTIAMKSSHARLRELQLGGNRFEGTIPPGLGEISSLRILSLSNNTLRGQIPRELGNLNLLEALYLQSNKLTGTIHPELAKMSGLVSLQIDENLLVGSVPYDMANLHKIKKFVLDQNILCCQAPSVFIKCNACCLCRRNAEELRVLRAFYNATNGANWTINNRWLDSTTHHCNWYGITCDTAFNVIGIALTDNGLSGAVPADIGNLAYLEVLRLNRNNLQQTIPSNIGNATKLTQLELQSNGLSGTLPSTLYNLEKLEILDLSYNTISGVIDSNIGRLSGLTRLDLRQNSLNGTIPSQLQRLRKLTHLLLNGNFMVGSVPMDLRRLRLLREFYVDETVDCCEDEFLVLGCDACCICRNGKLQMQEEEALRSLYLATNGQEWDVSVGWLDREVRHCRWSGISCSDGAFVSSISLANNSLQGTLPSDVFRHFSQLSRVDLGMNNLEGGLSRDIGELPALEEFLAPSNRFTGTIPSTFSSLENLRTLDLRFNQLSGRMPKLFGKISTLGMVLLTGNFLNGTLPLFESRVLTHLHLDDNMFQGTLPLTIEKISLRELKLSNQGKKKVERGDNHPGLSGTIPDIFRDTGQLQLLDLARNSLSGEIPPSLGLLGRINVLDLSDNNLVGSITSELASLRNKSVVLRLGNNIGLEKISPLTLCTEFANFDLKNDYEFCPPERSILRSFYQSTIGDGWAYQSGWDDEYARHCNWYGVGCINNVVTSLTLARNGLAGEIPEEISVIDTIEHLDLSVNNITGSIPSLLGRLQALKGLHLNDNTLTGELSHEIGRLTHIEELNLAQNNLVGTIPAQLGDLTKLQKLHLHTNKFYGPMPTSLNQVENLHDLRLDLDIGCCEEALEGNACYLCTKVKEKTVLLDLYNSTAGNEWQAAFGWDSSDYCSWFGIQCDAKGVHVEEIVLPENNLGGTIPQDLVHLIKLSRMDLSRNSVSGTVPSELFQWCSALENLTLSENGLFGKIPPSIENCESLAYLELSGNRISGLVPKSIGSLRSLAFLSLHSNELSGNLPSSLSELSKLQETYLSHNKLTGTIPTELANLPFTVLHLQGNMLVGDASWEISKRDNVSFITDCGEPQDYLLSCKTCTMCCNAIGFCQVNISPKFSVYEQVAIMEVVLVTFLTLATVAGRLMVKRWGVELTISRNNAELLSSNLSVYSFFLTRRYWKWLVALVTVGIQTIIFILFISAARIGEEDSDWKYTFRCPRNNIDCKDERSRTWAGWTGFFIIILASLSKDIIDSFRLLYVTASVGCMRHYTYGIVLMFISFLAVWTSTVYNLAIAETNTELMANAVIVLFVNDLDEFFFSAIEHLRPDWVEHYLEKLRSNLDFSDIMAKEDVEDDGSSGGGLLPTGDIESNEFLSCRASGTICRGSDLPYDVAYEKDVTGTASMIPESVDNKARLPTEDDESGSVEPQPARTERRVTFNENDVIDTYSSLQLAESADNKARLPNSDEDSGSESDVNAVQRAGDTFQIESALISKGSIYLPPGRFGESESAEKRGLTVATYVMKIAATVEAQESIVKTQKKELLLLREKTLAQEDSLETIHEKLKSQEDMLWSQWDERRDQEEKLKEQESILEKEKQEITLLLERVLTQEDSLENSNAKLRSQEKMLWSHRERLREQEEKLTAQELIIKSQKEEVSFLRERTLVQDASLESCHKKIKLQETMLLSYMDMLQKQDEKLNKVLESIMNSQKEERLDEKSMVQEASLESTNMEIKSQERTQRCQRDDFQEQENVQESVVVNSQTEEPALLCKRTLPKEAGLDVDCCNTKAKSQEEAPRSKPNQFQEQESIVTCPKEEVCKTTQAQEASLIDFKTHKIKSVQETSCEQLPVDEFQQQEESQAPFVINEKREHSLLREEALAQKGSSEESNLNIHFQEDMLLRQRDKFQDQENNLKQLAGHNDSNMPKLNPHEGISCVQRDELQECEELHVSVMSTQNRELSLLRGKTLLQAGNLKIKSQEEMLESEKDTRE